MNSSHSGLFNLDVRSLRNHPWKGAIQRIMTAALRAVDPRIAIERIVKRQSNILAIAEREYNLNDYRRIFLVGAGKAGAPMAQGISKLLGERISHSLVIVKDGYKTSVPGINLVEAGHPIPDPRGVRAARQIVSLLQQATADDLVICLISGGGSALMTCPENGVTLADLQSLTSLLLACGADINEINTLRKHLDQLKGGKLARLAHPARLVALILSDVVGDPLEVIASGPSVADPTTFASAYQVLQRYNLLDEAPPAVIAHLQRGMKGELEETPKPGDPLLEGVYNLIVGSNRIAAQAALDQARCEGMNCLLLTTYLQGEARQVGRFLGAILRQEAATGEPIPPPACIVAGGETTVNLKGDGLGGRNQEVALGAVNDLAGLEQVLLVTLATDGGDGPSDAAGAVVCGDTLERARRIGLDPEDYLKRNDSYHFFEPLGDLIKTGPTLTNAGDLAFLFAF